MSYTSVSLHPAYSSGFIDQMRKLSGPKMVLAIATLGGSLLANQHWELGSWSCSSTHKILACLENIPVLGGIVAAIERLGIFLLCKRKLDSSTEIHQQYFKYKQENSQTVLIKAKEHKDFTIKCSLIDHFSSQKPVSTVFFYKKHIDKDLIVGAIEHALKDFPLFAGRLRRKEGRLYIDCNNEGVGFTCVNSNSYLSKLLSIFSKLSPTTFVDEINPHAAEKKNSPVLQVKLSYFPDGLAIGYSWHHSLGDMSTFMQFLNAVSSYAKQECFPSPTLLKDRENEIPPSEGLDVNSPQPAYLKILSWGDIYQFIKQQCFPTRTVYLHFTNEELAELQAHLSKQKNKKFSRNDVLCAHLLEVLARCRGDASNTQHASIAINVRRRIKIDPNTPGNILGMASIQVPKDSSSAVFAEAIHQNVSDYRHDPRGLREFVQQQGGVQKIQWMIPEAFLPKNRNHILTSWANFGVYSIDFGVAAPDLFLPVGGVPLPWISRIVEGMHNKGLLVALTLPSEIAARLTQSETLREVHKYRTGQNQDESEWNWIK